MKKNLEISCYRSAPKIMIICNTVSKIWCVCVCVCNRCNSYFSFWAIFAILPPNSPKNQNSEKNVTCSEYSFKCTLNVI